MKDLRFTSILLLFSFSAVAQSGSWQLWATGLTSGAFPRLAIAPNHDIFFVRMSSGGGITPGVIYKANTQSAFGTFTALPAIPVPASLVNNVYSITTNQNSEPIAGIFRSISTDPWLYRFNNATQQWVTASSNISPVLGAYCMERAPNGTIWVGAKWNYVYKSTDNGNTYTGIDQSANMPSVYPCYYPTWGGSTLDGAIYGLNIDHNGRVYVGTETNGLLYSDDAGATWKTVDYHLCKTAYPTQRDSFSTMRPANEGGNCAGIGFNINNDVVYSGGEMWIFNWPNEIALANMTNHTITPAQGIPNALITSGQQVSKIVTAINGQMFLHSGGAAGTAGVGIYTSMDGINWTIFNTGITGTNLGQSQGSLAVDGNKVFMATQDGQIWRYSIPIVLPINLVNISVSAAGHKNVIQWITARENNSSTFEIERSIDAFNFTTIGSVRAAGSSTSNKKYNFIDSQPNHSTTYYRIKEVDLDGGYKFSNVVNCKPASNELYSLYPNLSNNNITIKSITNKKIDRVRIYNNSGQEFHLSPVISGPLLQFDISSLQKGLYFFQVYCGDQQFTEKVVKD